MDDEFDYQWFQDCSGSRSLDLIVSYISRIDECGDLWLGNKTQNCAAEFAHLLTTTWRGEPAFVVPIHEGNTTLVLTAPDGLSSEVPLFGAVNAVLNNRLNMVVPMTPNTRHELSWLREWVATNGNRANVQVTFGALTMEFKLGFRKDGIDYNLQRY